MILLCRLLARVRMNELEACLEHSLVSGRPINILVKFQSKVKVDSSAGRAEYATNINVLRGSTTFAESIDILTPFYVLKHPETTRSSHRRHFPHSMTSPTTIVPWIFLAVINQRTCAYIISFGVRVFLQHVCPALLISDTLSRTFECNIQ